jgi:peptidoglycan lytic transglycosylase
MTEIVIRRTILTFAALLGACLVALCLPTLGAASSGGQGFGPAPSGASPDSGAGSGGAGGTAAQPGDVTVTSSADGMTIATRASALLRNGLVVAGSLPSGGAGRIVDIELLGAKTNWVWKTVAQSQVGGNGTFSGTWQTNHIGRFAIRAVLDQGGAASASAGLPTVTVTVYRPSLATLYGPGFWGRRTACGTILRRQTVGVANRTLPCGTPVAIYYQGHTITVPVVDRGPYANGADWDLTIATGRALGMNTTAMLGAVSLPRTG